MRAPVLLVLSLSTLACRPGAPVDDAAPAPATITSAGSLQTPIARALMRDHERHGATLRDAITRGDLVGARREGRILSESSLSEPVDARWRSKLAAMNVAAGRVAASTDLDEASKAAAELAASCGECHAALEGPKRTFRDRPPEGDDVTTRMQRHRWGAARLWDGLVIPSDDAWKSGARVLTEAPMEPEALTPGKSPVPKVGALARFVHDLGRRAESTDSTEGRAMLFGEVLATCSSCHEWLGGGPPKR